MKILKTSKNRFLWSNFTHNDFSIQGRPQASGPIPGTKSGPSPGEGFARINPWIGKRVKTRWPADNTFYEAVITDYDPEKVSLLATLPLLLNQCPSQKNTFCFLVECELCNEAQTVT